MVTETELHYRQPCYDSVRMAQQQRQYSPTPETVSSAADAMLKLSGGSHHGGGRGEYLYHSPKQGDRGANMYNAQVEYRSPGSMSSTAPCSPPSPMISSTVPTSPRMRSASLSRMQRKEREFVPDYRKDTQYWLKRQKNNEAAKRSREKRRMNDMVMSDKLSQVSEEKHKLQMELDAIKRHFGLPLDKPFHSGDTSHSVSPSSSPGKTPGSDTTRSSPLYDNGSPPIKPAPPLIPLQGRLAEVIAQRMMSKPPPLEPVPDSPPVGSVSPVYPQQRQMYNNMANNSQVQHSQRQQHHHHPQQQQQQHQQQHYSTSQQYGMSVPVKQQPESPQSAASSDHPQFQYNMMYSQQQSPCSPSYPSVQSPRSPQNLQIVLSPQPSDHSSQNQADHGNSGHSYADHDSNRDDHNNAQAHDDLGAPLNLCKRRRIDLEEEQEEKQSMPVRAEQRKGIPHKLRYKNYSSEIREAEQDSNDGTSAQWHIPENSSSSPQLSMANVYQHTMRQNSDDQGSSYRERREACYSTSSSAHLESSMDGSDNSQPFLEGENNTAHQDAQLTKPDNVNNTAGEDDDEEANPKYLERRERNNMAARKCRENRRIANELRLVKSHVLENENVKLKDELRSLSEEVHGLKKLIEKKHQAEEAGETFEPPEELITKIEQDDH